MLRIAFRMNYLFLTIRMLIQYILLIFLFYRFFILICWSAFYTLSRIWILIISLVIWYYIIILLFNFLNFWCWTKIILFILHYTLLVIFTIQHYLITTWVIFFRKNAFSCWINHRLKIIFCLIRVTLIIF